MKKIKYSKLNIDKSINYNEQIKGRLPISSSSEEVKDGIVYRIGEFDINSVEAKIKESIKNIDSEWIKKHIKI